MIKTSSQVVTAFLGEPHPHSARVGDAFSRGWGDILRSYEAPSSSREGTIRSLRGPDLLEQEDPLLVRGDDIQQAVAVEIRDDELGSDAALVIDLAG